MEKEIDLQYEDLYGFGRVSAILNEKDEVIEITKPSYRLEFSTNNPLEEESAEELMDHGLIAAYFPGRGNEEEREYHPGSYALDISKLNEYLKAGKASLSNDGTWYELFIGE